MSSQFIRSVAAIAAVCAIASPAIAQRGGASSRAAVAPLKGVSYTLRMRTRLPQIMEQMQNGGVPAPSFLVKVKAYGKNARFEFDSMPQGTPIPSGDYMLFLESGRAIRVSPKEKLYDEAPNGFGSAGGGISLLNSVGGRGGRGADITGIDMDVQQLDDETIQGRQVRHYQLVTEFTLEVMNQTTPVRIEMETWTADLAPNQTIINPFDLAGSISPSDPTSKLTTRLMAERKKMQGTPIKTSMNFILSGLANGAIPALDFGQTTEVLDIRSIDIDPKELDVPPGFTKREPRAGRGGADTVIRRPPPPPARPL
jgi:hypothetical protein